MSTSTTKYRFLSGASQQIRLLELSSQGITSSMVAAANGSGGWNIVSASGGGTDAALYTFTSSVKLFSASVLVATASLQSASGSIQQHSGAVNSFTASMQAYTASINTFTASAVNSTSSTLLWKWNETDTSQFTVGFDQIGTASLSVETGSGAPTLRVTWPTKTTGEKVCVIYINDFTIPTNHTYYSRFEFSYRHVAFSGTAGQWYSMGPAVLCNKQAAPKFRALSHGYQLGVAARSWKVQNNAITASGATPSWGNVANPLTPTSPVDGIADRVVAQVFQRISATVLTFRNELLIIQPISVATNQTGMRSDTSYVINQLGAFDSEWTTSPPTTCGFSFYGNTGAGTNQYFEFDNFYILRHPMDR